MYARRIKMQDFYFYIFLIINAGVLIEAQLGIGQGPYDPITDITAADLFGKNGLFPIRILPKNYPPINETVTFHCLKPNSTTYNQVYVNDTNIGDKLDLSKPVAIYTHGWLDTFNNSLFLRVDGDGWMIRMGRDWARYVDTNVCAVGWGRLSRYIYSVAAYNTKIVGPYVGQFAEFLYKQGIPLDNITIAGHSMGGQICGYAGQYLKSVNLYLRRIIAWDPAGILYTHPVVVSKSDRLDKSDAKFVEVIHTSVILGSYLRSGHVDFYVNGGIYQRGCALKILQPGLPKTIPICDHYRSVEYFQYSLNPKNKFVGTTCWPLSNKTSCKTNVLGVNTKEIPGKYWLQTTLQVPYCEGCS